MKLKDKAWILIIYSKQLRAIKMKMTIRMLYNKINKYNSNKVYRINRIYNKMTSNNK